MPPELPPIATLLIIIATGVVSVPAFTNHVLRDKLIFSPRAILAEKEYHRLVTSAFLHADWQHLVFNMISLYFFGQTMEPAIGAQCFLLIYFASIVGGDLLSLYLHRNHEYFSLGASGGVCGIIFSSVFLFPGIAIGFFMLPVRVPGWLYAILFLAFEFYGGRRQRSNIGHDAHLGGALIGLLTTTALFPEIVRWSPRLYATVMAMSVIMFVYLWKNPLNLPPGAFFRGWSGPAARTRKAGPTAGQVDAILEKVSREGIQSLTKKEREILDQAAKK
jgi:membrane associated rhomboid family serine protease